MKALFVDPGSNSSGWALFDESGKLLESGTISAPEGKDVFLRLQKIHDEYFELGKRLKPEQVFFERLSATVSESCVWSVGVIGEALKAAGVKGVNSEKKNRISQTEWQAAVGWVRQDGGIPNLKDGSPLHRFWEGVDSPDELAAIGMGLYWLSKRILS